MWNIVRHKELQTENWHVWSVFEQEKKRNEKNKVLLKSVLVRSLSISHASLGAETCFDIFISITSISNVKTAYGVKISLSTYQFRGGHLVLYNGVSTRGEMRAVTRAVTPLSVQICSVRLFVRIYIHRQIIRRTRNAIAQGLSSRWIFFRPLI